MQQNCLKNVQPTYFFVVCSLQRKWQFHFQIKIKHLKEFVIWSNFIEADWINLSIFKSVLIFLSVPGLNSGNHLIINLNLSSPGETFQHKSKSYWTQSQLFSFCWSEECEPYLFQWCRFCLVCITQCWFCICRTDLIPGWSTVFLYRLQIYSRINVCYCFNLLFLLFTIWGTSVLFVSHDLRETMGKE